MNKKAMNYFSDWGEFFFLVLLFIGLVIGVLSPSAMVTYLIAFFAGALTGRIMWFRKKKMKAPYILIVIGFVLGFIVGTFRHGNRAVTILLFLLGSVASYYVYRKGLVKDTFT